MHDEMQPDNTEMQPDMGQDMAMGGMPQQDNEGAMAKADLYKLANYSFKLFKKIEPEAQLEGWIQAKITKAADYIASVYHYLEYEMKFSQYGQALDNSDVLSESEKAELKNKLMEAKQALASIKIEQAERLKEYDLKKTGDSKKTATGVLTKTATGVKHERTDYSDEERGEVNDTHAKSKSAAEKKSEAPKQKKSKTGTWGMEGGEKFDNRKNEGFEAGAKTGSTFKTKTGVATKTKTGLTHTNTSFNDEEHGEPASKVKEKSAAEKKADKEKEIKLPKHKGNTWGMKGGEKFGKKMEEGAKPDYIDADGDGDEKESMKKALKDKKKKSVKESTCPKCHEDPCSCTNEGQEPSAGLSKAKKSAVVKKAKAGGDIGKPGKSFDAVAKKAGGGEKGKKIAAAAMWKNIKETVQAEVVEAKKAKPDFADLDKDGDKKEPMKKAAKEKKEVVKESAELDRMKEFLTRLNG